MSSILQKQVGVPAPTVSLVTTAETVLCYSGRVEVTMPTVRAIVKGWANITVGASTTGVFLNLRRGNGISGPIAKGGPTITVNTNLQMEISIMFAESLQNAEYADYTLTAQQIAATANGSLMLAMLEVEIING